MEAKVLSPIPTRGVGGGKVRAREKGRVKVLFLRTSPIRILLKVGTRQQVPGSVLVATITTAGERYAAGAAKRKLDYIQHLYSCMGKRTLTNLHILPRWDTCRAMADKGGKVKEVGRLSYVVPVIKSVAV